MIHEFRNGKSQTFPIWCQHFSLFSIYPQTLSCFHRWYRTYSSGQFLSIRKNIWTTKGVEFLQHLNSVTYWFKDPGGVRKLNHVNPWVEWGIGSGHHFSLSSGRRKTQVLYLVICNRLRTQMDLQSVNGFMSGPILPSSQMAFSHRNVIFILVWFNLTLSWNLNEKLKQEWPSGVCR